jgi:hypothetical protein
MTRSVGPKFDWLCKCAPEYWHALLHFCCHSDAVHYRPIGFLSNHSRTNAPWSTKHEHMRLSGATQNAQVLRFPC